MWKSASIGSTIALSIFASDLSSAQSTAEFAADIKVGLENCREFHGRPFNFTDFMENGRRRESYRYAEVRYDAGNVMHWTKYNVTRTEGSSSVSGRGSAYFYTVRLSDLTPDMPLEEVRVNNQNTGVFYVLLKCQGGSACVAQNQRRLQPPSQTRAGILTPVERWRQAPTTSHTLRDVRLHVCAGRLGGSRDMAEALRREMSMLITRARGGSPAGASPYPALPPQSAPPSSAPEPASQDSMF